MLALDLQRFDQHRTSTPPQARARTAYAPLPPISDSDVSSRLIWERKPIGSSLCVAVARIPGLDGLNRYHLVGKVGRDRRCSRAALICVAHRAVLRMAAYSLHHK